MGTRLRKEVRELWPLLAGSLLLIQVPYLIWGRHAEDFGLMALGLGCLIMAASMFGHEFQHRTATLLLAQPIARSRIWLEKLSVLGPAVLICTLVLWWNLRQFSADYLPVVLILVPLCAFCGGPWLTLQLGGGIAGAAAAAGMPGGLLACEALVMVSWLHMNGELGTRIMIGSVFAYCVAAYCLGYRAFQRYEVIDGAQRELTLPLRLESWLAQVFGGVSNRFTGSFAVLVKKELHLQQVAFVIAGLFMLGAIAGGVLHQFDTEWGAAILALSFSLCLLLMPFLTGAMSTAEEWGWGLAEWHLTLPPSAQRQWGVKSLVTLGLSLALGLVLPGLVWLVMALFAGGVKAEDLRALLVALPQIVLFQLLLTSLASYAGSFSRNTLRAILMAFGLLLVISCGLWLLIRFGHWIDGIDSGTWDLLCGGLFLLLVLLQRFAFVNFKRGRLSIPRFLLQFAAVFALAAVVLFAIEFRLMIVHPVFGSFGTTANVARPALMIAGS